MAARKLSTDFPSIVLRKMDSLEQVYIGLTVIARAINDVKIQSVTAINNHADRLTPTTGTGVPATTPDDTLLYYLDTAAKDMYVSVGTASSADWKKITP